MQTNVPNPDSPQQPIARDTPSSEILSTNLGPGIIDAKHEPFRRYKLVGRDDQEVLQTAEDLLEGSKLLMNKQLFIANLIAVFKKIRSWCDQQAAHLSGAFVSFHASKLSIFFVSATDRYDLDVDEAMTALEVELGGSAGIGSVESFQIPVRSIEQFVGDDALLLWKRV